MDWTVPIINQSNRMGDVLMYADQARRRDEMVADERHRNALMQSIQLHGLQKQQEQENALKSVWQGLDFETADPAKLMQAARAIGGIDPKMGIALMQKATELENKRATERDKAEFQGEYRRDMLDLRRQGLENQRLGLGIQQQNANQRTDGTGIDRTIDLGDRVEIHRKDGTVEVKPKAASPTATEQTSRPPRGMMWDEDKKLRPILGSEQHRKMQAGYATDNMVLETVGADLDMLKADAQKLLDHKGLPAITGRRSYIPNFVNQDAVDAQAILDSLTGKTFVAAITNMRKASPTGAAVGNVTEKEGDKLQAALVSLKNAQSEESMRSALQQVIAYSTGGKNRLQKAFDLEWGDYKQSETGPKDISAPPEAIELLRSNPKLAGAFKSKYGYLPEGF